MSRNRLYYDIGLTACQLLCISRNDIAIPLKYSIIKNKGEIFDGKLTLQDARILAICKLHPARITINQTADATRQDNGLV